MRRRTLTLNLFALVVIPLAIYLGATGLVSWWVIALVGLSHVEARLTFEVGR